MSRGDRTQGSEMSQEDLRNGNAGTSTQQVVGKRRGSGADATDGVTVVRRQSTGSADPPGRGARSACSRGTGQLRLSTAGVCIRSRRSSEGGVTTTVPTAIHLTQPRQMVAVTSFERGLSNRRKPVSGGQLPWRLAP